VPYADTLWFFRADKYSPSGVNMIPEAVKFRAGLRLAPLAQYEANPNTGAPKILPIFPYFAFSFKVAEDTAVLLTPNAFLRQTQRAVHNPATQPMYASDLQLSQAFDKDFAAARQAAARGNPVPLARIDAAARGAYFTIVRSFMSHVIPGTHWIFFNNVAAWGTAYLDRADTTEYFQYSNNLAAAAYWLGFTDGTGRTLIGARGYRLTFPANNIPDAKRFWSVTAYVPRTIELVPNAAKKYLVGSYTPGLVTSPNGSITITMAPTRPAGVPMANWLPVPRGKFNICLRVYGPIGNTADGKYTPPAITPIG
jgi:hypothetical protein